MGKIDERCIHVKIGFLKPIDVTKNVEIIIKSITSNKYVA